MTTPTVIPRASQRCSEAACENMADQNARNAAERQQTIAQAFQQCCAGHHDPHGRRDLVD